MPSHLTQALMPTPNEIKEKVKSILAEEASIQPSDVIESAKLNEPPLSLDKSDLLPVTIKLRRYVKTYKNTETVLVKETRSPGLNVKGLIQLINIKLNEG